ncbi:PhoH-like phosphate starvation-inducible [Yersinia phage phiR2-01]|uniref:Phosphate starvation-inducible protein PhoH,predicted ATPase n=1 Tax=Yersinia phage phiR2-01 TaxID=1206557 RepID=I7J3U2_9CAUD|nr:PhoH-like phosphate starvation-inducible [Yersinia phage phiR2-01]CCI88518.1 phosphate starvation-inducible protein PhoH,predicted ATPase [Yersinia phage phiR2-01]
MGKPRQKRENQRNGSRKRSNNYESNVIQAEFSADYATPVAKSLEGKNREQKSYINMIKNNTVTVGIGEPGTGKTFIPSVLAAQELVDRHSDIEQVILVRPNEPLGKSLGMLPGDLAEKLEPWLEPIADGMKWAIGDHAYKGYVERQKIKFLAIEHARGRTFNNSYVIVDEAQNISVEAMICLLTRVGQDCKLIICGDIAQKDIKEKSGLKLLMDIYEKYERSPFSMIELVENVRSVESKAFYDIFKDMGLV